LHRRSTTKPARRFARRERPPLFLSTSLPCFVRNKSRARGDFVDTFRKRTCKRKFEICLQGNSTQLLLEALFGRARNIRNIKLYFEKNGKRERLRLRCRGCLHEYCILFPSSTDGMLDSPSADVLNEDRCIKTRQVDVNRANRVFVTTLALLSPFLNRH